MLQKLEKINLLKIQILMNFTIMNNFFYPSLQKDMERDLQLMSIRYKVLMVRESKILKPPKKMVKSLILLLLMKKIR